MYDKVRNYTKENTSEDRNKFYKTKTHFFNNNFNVYLAEPIQSKLSPSDSCVRQSTKYSIDDTLKMTPNGG